MVRNRNRYRYLAPRLLTLTLIVALLAAAADQGSFRSSAVSAQDEATPEAAAPTGGVDITLTSPDGSPLAGACFAVTDAAGVTLTGCDEDGDGVTRIDRLAAGTAAVVEATFPAGYTGTPDGTVEIVPGDFASIGFTNALIATPEPTPSPTVEPSPTAPQSPANELQSTVQQESVTGQLAVTTVFDQGGSVTRTCFKVYADAGGGERGPLVAAHCDQDDGQADGRLLFDGLDTQSYILVQTSAPASVARAADTPFTIMAGQTTALTIQEHPAGTLAVTTVDDTGQSLPGACYRAYLATASGTRGAYVGSGCDGTNADGVALVRSLPFGDYVLGQSTPPSGYTAAPDRPFSITNQSETPITVRQSLPGVLAITTVDPDLNASVAGACFRIYEDAGDGVRGSRIASGCDGDDGSADGARSFAGLTAGPYVLTELSAPSGYAPALNQTFSITSNQTTTITVQNRRASALSIAAVDDQQHAVPGDCLKVYTDNGKGKRGTFVTSGCDGDDGAADGTTHIATLAPNAYVLVDFTPPAGYAAGADQPFTIVAGQPAALTIQHRAGGEATISLLDPAGRPLPGACFSADLQQSGTTVARRCDKDDGAGDGKTTFVGLAPGTYRLHETTVPSGVAVVPLQTITIVAGQVTPVTLQSAAGGSVFITLVDDASQPIPGGCVTVRNGGQQVVRVDGNWAAGCDGDDHHLDGKITITGLSVGSYILVETVAPDRYILNTLGALFSVTGGMDVSLTLTHQLGGSVVITLLDEHQQPLPGACFGLRYDAGGGAPGGSVYGPGGYACDSGDGASDGTTTLSSVQTGNYVLGVDSGHTPPGYLPILQPAAVTAGQEYDVTIQAQVAGRAVVTVVDEKNAPVLNACFAVYTDAGGRTRGSRVDSFACDGSDGVIDGITVLDHLPSGSYVLAAGNRVQWHQVFSDQPFTVEARHDTPITIQSPTGGQVIVTTLDQNGQRIAGMCYILYDYLYVAGDGGYSTRMATACDVDDGLDGVTTFYGALHAPHTYRLDMLNPPRWYGYGTTVRPGHFNLSPHQTIRLTVQEGANPDLLFS